MPGDGNRDRVHHRLGSRPNLFLHAHQRQFAHMWAVVLRRFRDYMAAGGPAPSPEESDVKP